jgi:phosphate-selective porin
VPEPKKELAPPASETKKKDAKFSLPLEAMYEEGFGLRTKDKKVEVKIAASTQLDGRFYAGDSVSPHSFDIRRARIDFQAKIFSLLSIRIQAAMEDNPYIRNAQADLNLWEALHLRVGQMKVPFSSSWLAFDNQVDFLERATAEPFYPFFDRGAMLWGNLLGQRLSYNIGIFTGVGVDLDQTKGDIDGHKDLAWRVFLQPFRDTPATFLEGLYLAVDGTWGNCTVPTKRFETRGLMAANYESQVWRWRTEQTIGTNGRNTDQMSGEIDARTRFGAELHYLLGPFTFSGEWAMVKYKGIRLYHDFYQGSTRLKHDSLFGDYHLSNSMHNLSGFVSVFLTGEKKVLDNFGWKQPVPRRPLGLTGRGIGAFEILGRFSATLTDDSFFENYGNLSGYKTTDFIDPKNPLKGPAPGENGSVKIQVLDGAPKLYEMTLGLNWTMNYHFRVQLDYIYLWAPSFDATKKTGGIISGGNSDLYDATVKNTQVKSEHTVGMRFIMRI